MQVAITAAALRYLASRSKHVTISLPELKVQCCVPYAPPEVLPGLPRSSVDYVSMPCDEVTVHVPSHVVNSQDHLTIVLQGVGPFKALGIEGWRAFGAVSL